MSIRADSWLGRIVGALARRPDLNDLRHEFPDWDITGSRREGFTARKADEAKHDPDSPSKDT